MTEDLKDLLRDELKALFTAAEALRFSLSSCRDLLANKKNSLKDLEAIEALTSRFARLGDILIQKIFRLIDEIELENEGTVRDRVNRAEKRGLISSAEKFVDIRRLRNRIAHEYVPEAAEKFFSQTYKLSDTLLDSVGLVRNFCKQRYSAF